MAAARAVGIPADYDLEGREARATASLRGAIEQQLFQVQDPAAGVDSQEISLMQMAAAQLPPALATDSMVHHIAAMQRKEGDWPNYGVVRPPLEDGGFSHTAKGIRALRLYPIPGRKSEFDERVARAATWLEARRTANDGGSDACRSSESHGPDTKHPRTGSSNWSPNSAPMEGGARPTNLASDAYATGEALWALHESGMPASDAAYRRGVNYLLGTQHEDGTGTLSRAPSAFQPYFQSGFPYDHDQWISQAGTAMATIALTYAGSK